jgi:hypothetical protein
MNIKRLRRMRKSERKIGIKERRRGKVLSKPNQPTTMLVASEEASDRAVYTRFRTAIQAVLESSHYRVGI